MEYKLLGHITYYKSLPQFGPINYIMYENHLPLKSRRYMEEDFPKFTPIDYIVRRDYVDDRIYSYKHFQSRSISDESIMAALLISELPVIFKKYNIKLFKNDINLWVNPRDNVARVFDVKRVLNNEDVEYKEEVLFTKDFFDFWKNIESLRKCFNPNNNFDKAIEELINKRYGYYYNKYDSDANYKFIEFLDEQIRLWGQIPTFEYNADNLKMTKIDKSEQFIRQYFYSVKVYSDNNPVVFLSERIEKIYEILAAKYPEIRLEKCYSTEEYLSLKDKPKATLINDVNYEFDLDLMKYGKKLNYHCCSKIEKSDYTSLNIFIDNFSELTTPHEEMLKERDKKITTIMGRNLKSITREIGSNLQNTVDLLETERRLLENNGIEDAVELLPLPFQEYFRFCLENSEQLERFKEKYQEAYERRKGDITIFEIETIVGELVNEFGSAQITRELVELILATNSNSVWLHHEPIIKIENNTKNIGNQKVKKYN